MLTCKDFSLGASPLTIRFGFAVRHGSRNVCQAIKQSERFQKLQVTFAASGIGWDRISFGVCKLIHIPILLHTITILYSHMICNWYRLIILCYNIMHIYIYIPILKITLYSQCFNIQHGTNQCFGKWLCFTLSLHGRSSDARGGIQAISIVTLVGNLIEIIQE